MAEEGHITVTIKSSADAKYEISVAPTATVAELKELIATKADVPATAQRLIYSGRVLKDAETIESYKVKDGQTIHLVKSAAAKAAPATSTSTVSPSSTASASSPAPASQVPSNIAAGQGSFNPLADLTGARYAGYAQLPSASMFGPDGGMQLPNPEDMERMLENPQVQQGMNEMLRNPQMLDYLIQQSPQLRAMGPRARELLQSDMFRDMMTNPQMMRQMRQMSGMMGGANPAAPAFPAPGTAGDDSDAPAAIEGAAGAAATDAAANPAAAANPFAAMFPGGVPPANPFAMFGPPGAAGAGAGAGAGGFGNFDSDLTQAIMNSLGGAGAGTGAAAAPADNRPPEERYEEQLRQLNEMGFSDFESNVRALRRSGGSVQGAIENLLNGV